MSDLKHAILSRVADDLAGVEQALAGNLNPYFQEVADVAGHLLFSGGKRLRPLLLLLCSRVCGNGACADYVDSTVVEYLHTATLLHDDLVDGGETRRGRPAAHTLWDNSVTVLVGDFLLARALSLAARTRRIRVIDTVAAMTEDISQGEIRQIHNKMNLALTEDEYMDVIHRKTAVLLEGSCRIGAIIAGADDRREAALADFGRNLGMAFQMCDDLLDYTADVAELGKKTGADLREGKLTLPVIRALAIAGEDDRKWMEKIILSPDFSEEEFSRFTGFLENSGAIAYTREKAGAFVEAAKSMLAGFPASETAETLSMIADYALLRKM